MNVDLAREQLIKDLLSQFNNPRNISEKSRALNWLTKLGARPF